MSVDWGARTACVDGAFVALENARVSILDRGYLFGDGVYEVTAVLEGKLIDHEGHALRLARSLGEIGIERPSGLADLAAIELELVRRNGLEEGLVYLQVTRGVAERDFAFPSAAEPSFALFTQAKPLRRAEHAEKGIAAISTPDLRWARRDIKSIALLAQVLAKQEAAKAGAFEAIMHEDGVVTEGASSTVFAVDARGALLTRPLSNAVLPSVTRASLLRLRDEIGLELEERSFTLREARAAKELFVASASTLIAPIVELDGAPIGDGAPGPIATRLREIYLDAALARAIG